VSYSSQGDPVTSYLGNTRCLTCKLYTTPLSLMSYQHRQHKLIIIRYCYNLTFPLSQDEMTLYNLQHYFTKSDQIESELQFRTVWVDILVSFYIKHSSYDAWFAQYCFCNNCIRCSCIC